MNQSTPIAGAETSAPADTIGFSTVLRGMRRYPVVSLLFAIGAVAAAAAVWLYLPLPKMTGYVIFHVSAQPQSILTPVGDARTDFTYYRQAQVALIKSRPVLNMALNQPEIAKAAMLKEQPDPYAWLEKVLQISFPASQEFMRLSVEGDQSDELLGILEAVKVAYMREVIAKDKSKRDARFMRLAAIQKRYGEELEHYRTRLKNLTDTLGSGDQLNLALREKFLNEQLGLAQRELFQLRSEMRRSEIETATFDLKVKGADSIADQMVMDAIRAEPGYQRLSASRTALQESIDTMKKELVPGARPAFLADREKQLEEINKELAAYPEKVRPVVAGQLRDLYVGQNKRSQEIVKERIAFQKDLERAIERETIALSEKLQKMNIGQVSLESLRSEMSQAEKTADRIQQEMEAMRPEFEAPMRVSVWEEPTVVSGIEGNRRLKYSLLTAGGILIFGIVIVTYLEYRVRRAVHPQDVSGSLGLRLIGTVPWIPHQGEIRGRTTSERAAIWRSLLNEYVDAARTMLLHSLPPSSRGRTIQIASANPGEAKSMLASHLALSLARTGAKTLLIDGDLRRPTLHRILGTRRTPGLSELLLERAKLVDVLQPSSSPTLSFLSAGAWEPAVSKELSSGRWAALKAELEAEFDYLIVDSSPILLVTDAVLLARHVDGVVLSVLRNVSQMDCVQEARERLNQLGVTVLGVVVNGVDRPSYKTALSYYHPHIPTTALSTPAVTNTI